MSARQERQRLLRQVAQQVQAARYAAALELLEDGPHMGRTDRWRMAVGRLRIALHDAVCGDEPVALDDLLSAAKVAAR